MTVKVLSFAQLNLLKLRPMLLPVARSIIGLTALSAAERPPEIVAMTRRMLSRTFRSLKNTNPRSKVVSNSPSSSRSSGKLSTDSASASTPVSDPRLRAWSVYLILSTNDPIKTYVGVTTDFARRLKQHNGELKGGAKSSSSGRPWVCACIIRGFKDHGEACSFESKWKILSRKLPRRRKGDDVAKEEEDARSVLLLRHREAALNRLKSELDCSHLEIDWQLSLS